jgi:hypothetical protein
MNDELEAADFLLIVHRSYFIVPFLTAPGARRTLAIPLKILSSGAQVFLRGVSGRGRPPASAAAPGQSNIRPKRKE